MSQDCCWFSENCALSSNSSRYYREVVHSKEVVNELCFKTTKIWRWVLIKDRYISAVRANRYTNTPLLLLLTKRDWSYTNTLYRYSIIESILVQFRVCALLRARKLKMRCNILASNLICKLGAREQRFVPPKIAFCKAWFMGLNKLLLIWYDCCKFYDKLICSACDCIVRNGRNIHAIRLVLRCSKADLHSAILPCDKILFDFTR